MRPVAVKGVAVFDATPTESIHESEAMDSRLVYYCSLSRPLDKRLHWLLPLSTPSSRVTRIRRHSVRVKGVSGKPATSSLRSRRSGAALGSLCSSRFITERTVPLISDDNDDSVAPAVVIYVGIRRDR
jgi:hypothetical protein